MDSMRDEWFAKCTTIIENHNSVIRRRNNVAAAVATLIHQLKSQQKRRYRKKRYWVADIFESRLENGFHHDTFATLRLDDLRFRNYFRLNATQFEELLALIGPEIVKQDSLRAAIPADERLALTLRYLASGDSMTSISYHYSIGLATVSNIISETCGVIWDVLSPIVLKPCLEKDWREIADAFEKNCQFPHCIGALDGKHVIIQCPNNAGSSYFNYKGSHSIVLLALCDSNYLFRSVDIGGRGRQSDGGIFKQSLLGRKLETNSLDIPKAEPLWEGGPDVPFVIVADEAFPLTTYLLRPFPGKNQLTTEERIFNYRLSRARRMVENTFGILASQWRIYRKPILAAVKNAGKIVQATVCLHNWLRWNTNGGNNISEEMVDRVNEDGDVIEGTWRSLVRDGSALTDISHCGTNNNSRNAAVVRRNFTDYFNEEGAVPWQLIQIWK